FASVAPDVLQDHAAFVEIRNDSRATNFIELSLFRLDGFLCFFFQERELQIFKDQRRNLVDVYFCLVVVGTRILSRLASSSPTARTALAAYHIADASLAVTLSDV